MPDIFGLSVIGDRWLARIPQEDLAQATGTPPARKYEAEGGGPGIRQCLDLLLGSSNRVEQSLPSGFPEQVSQPILDGVRQAAARLLK